MLNETALAQIARCRETLKTSMLGISLMTLAAGASWAQMDSTRPAVKIDDDGTVHIPPMTVPVSKYLSPEGKAYLIDHLRLPQLRATDPQGAAASIERTLARQRELFAVDDKDTAIAGVNVNDYSPRAGVAPENARRVLINLHGGGFQTCFQPCGELESRPLAALGRIRVVSVDYRQGPEHRHPAGSEDVAAVYRELLKTYPAQNIGIYGCSAGGMLAAMSVAWFQTHELPRPGAIGVFCAGASVPVPGSAGDSAYLNTVLGEARTTIGSSVEANRAPPGYLENVDLRDPLVAPVFSDTVLARFPPTLVITGTRGMELSSAAFLHTRLVRQGVDARLHVWEGMFHGFFYNPDVPESRQAYDVMRLFFERRLGK